MQLSSDFYLMDACIKMDSYQLSSLYWLCRNLGPYWQPDLVSRMEMRLVELLQKEIEVQK